MDIVKVFLVVGFVCTNVLADVGGVDELTKRTSRCPHE